MPKKRNHKCKTAAYKCGLKSHEDMKTEKVIPPQTVDFCWTRFLKEYPVVEPLSVIFQGLERRKQDFSHLHCFGEDTLEAKCQQTEPQLSAWILKKLFLSFFFIWVKWPSKEKVLTNLYLRYRATTLFTNIKLNISFLLCHLFFFFLLCSLSNFELLYTLYPCTLHLIKL